METWKKQSQSNPIKPNFKGKKMLLLMTAGSACIDAGDNNSMLADTADGNVNWADLRCASIFVEVALSLCDTCNDSLIAGSGQEQGVFVLCVLFIRVYSGFRLRFIKSAIAVCTGLFSNRTS